MQNFWKMNSPSGPFNLDVGDEELFSFCIIFGQNKEDLIANAEFAQIMYNNKYQGYTPPQRPEVVATYDHGQISLHWSDDAEFGEDVVTGYSDFEGYKIYQLPNPLASGSEGALIAQYDVANGVMVITEKAVDPATGLVLEKPAHVGSDNGISRVVVIKTDALRNRPISKPNYSAKHTIHTFGLC